MINKMKRFRVKMLIAITVGAFTTFTMLLYMSSGSARCSSTSNMLCYYVYKEDNLATKNLSYHLQRDDKQSIILLTKPRNDALKRYQFISKAKVFNFKLNSIVTENFRASRTVRPTVSVVLKNNSSSEFSRTRRNSNIDAKVSKINFFSSVFAQKGSRTFPTIGNRIDPRLTPPNYLTSGKKSLTIDKNAEDDYFYIASNLVSLINNNKFNASRSKDSSFRDYIKRQRNLQQGCQNYYNTSRMLHVKRLKLDHILIDENRRILFCYVPKVACTNWKRIFMLLTGKASNISQVIRIPSYEVHTRNLFTSLQNYSLAEVNEILRDYTKFIFVRNPFERLLSAYRNKLEQHYDSSKYFQARFGKYIVRKFRKNPSNMSLERGDDVTFSEFVDYLISSNASSYNEHWQTVSNLCHPCFVNYDLIGKYETLIRDSNFVLNYLKLNFSFPALEKPSKTASNLKKYFNTLKKDVIYKLYSIYEMDFKLFGYDLFKTLNWSNGS